MGHDVLTTHDSGKSNQGIEDDAVLRFATETCRCIVTLNRKDFMRLHRGNASHAGIIVCTQNCDYADFADRIDSVIRQSGDLTGQLLRVVRSNPA